MEKINRKKLEQVKDYKAEVLKNYTKEEIIMDQLLNYECFYNSSDLNRAVEGAKFFGITEKEVLTFFEAQLKIYNETSDEIFFSNLFKND